MADVTFGVKVPEELKEQIQKLMQNSGLTGKDFMQQIINSYTLEKTKESIPAVAEDLKELQTLTQRINNIYLNLGYRIENITKAQQEQMLKELHGKDSIISDLQNKIEELRGMNELLNNNYTDIVNRYSELNNRVNELTENNNNIKALNDEYKNKIDTMAGIVEEYKDYKTEIEEYKKLLADAQSRSIELTNNIKDKDLTIEKLNSEIKAVKQDKEKIVHELNSKHNVDIEAIKERAEFSKDKAILELQRQYQKELQELQSKHNAEITEYQNKYIKLLDQFEDNRQNTHNKRVNKNMKDTLKGAK